VATVPLAWLIAEAAGQTHKLPIWRPGPDVQAMANQDSQYPSVHALCSGVYEEITSPKIARAPEIALSAVTTTGVRIPLGRFMVGKQNMSNNVRQNVALLTRLVTPHLKRFRLAVNQLARSRARRQGDTGRAS